MIPLTILSVIRKQRSVWCVQPDATRRFCSQGAELFYRALAGRDIQSAIGSCIFRKRRCRYVRIHSSIHPSIRMRFHLSLSRRFPSSSSSSLPSSFSGYPPLCLAKITSHSCLSSKFSFTIDIHMSNKFDDPRVLSISIGVGWMTRLVKPAHTCHLFMSHERPRENG